jgi:hypothetical protein
MLCLDRSAPLCPDLSTLLGTVEDQGTQRLDDDQAGEWLPLAEAAAHIGVSVKTARRRLKAGELTSRQVSTQHGQAYEVWVARNGYTSTQTSTVTSAGTQRVDATTLELVRLVDRLQRENRDLAGLVGALQERVGTLQLALDPPKEPASSGSSQTGAPGASPSETTREPSNTKHAWWHFWRYA